MTYRPLHAVATLVFLALSIPQRAQAELPPLISRDVLFGNPEKAGPQLSPDARRISWLAPDQKNVLQVWVKTVDKDDAQMVTADKKRGIRTYFWAWDGKTVLYLQDQDGDENFHVYGVDLETRNIRDYTPFQGVRASVIRTSHKRPDQILVQMNLRKRELMDVYRVNLRTGALELDTENPGDVAGWMADHNMVVRSAEVATPEGGTEIRVRTGARAPFKSWMKVGPEETLEVHGFTPDGKGLYLASSVGSDTARLVERSLATGAEKVLAESPKVDLGPVMVHPTRHTVQAAGFPVGRNEWKVLDPSVQADFDGIGKLADGDFFISSRDLLDQQWMVGFTMDSGPIRYYRWDRQAKQGTFLFVHQPKLEGLALAKMKHVVIPARDGLELNSYLTLPVGVEPKNLPMVLWVHGGPWARDQWGFNPTVQWLANRGYAVLQVNFRGSVGFGKKFLHAGDRQWGLKMHDDLIDAVNWAVKEGYADPKKVAIGGGSYGGYAALAGATFTPDVFRCAVDIVGPSSLHTLIRSIPPYWKPILSMFKQRMGDVEDPKDAELIKAASPLFSAHKIKIPLLIGQGANDPRVKQAESEQIVAAIEKNNGRVTYVLYPDEGHGFQRPENRIDFNARMEEFLAEQLGGRKEPLGADKVPGSSAVVRVIAPKAGAVSAAAPGATAK
jgi:dipeptidyl aminopeptidase/acylaminoacyl peptidase